MQPCQTDSRSFFEKLQRAEGLDLRDSRGKRHELAVVLVGVTLAVLSNRDGNLSSIHRHIQNHYEKLVAVLGVEKKRAISRAQLPRILEKVSIEVFDNLIFSHFGVKTGEKERKWFASDGKELRGRLRVGRQTWRSHRASSRARNRSGRRHRIIIAERKNRKSRLSGKC